MEPWKSNLDVRGCAGRVGDTRGEISGYAPASILVFAQSGAMEAPWDEADERLRVLLPCLKQDEGFACSVERSRVVQVQMA